MQVNSSVYACAGGVDTVEAGGPAGLRPSAGQTLHSALHSTQAGVEPATGTDVSVHDRIQHADL